MCVVLLLFCAFVCVDFISFYSSFPVSVVTVTLFLGARVD